MDAVKVLNPDGTTSVTGFKKIIKRKDGTIDWSKAKSPNIHTIAPASWDNAKILSAGNQVGNSPGVLLRESNGVKTTVHTAILDGVKWQVVKDNGVITSSYPTGG